MTLWEARASVEFPETPSHANPDTNVFGHMRIDDELSSSGIDRASLITVGVFDGVHRGHRHLISRLVEEASARGSLSGVVTFRTHPAELLDPAFPTPVSHQLAGARPAAPRSGSGLRHPYHIRPRPRDPAGTRLHIASSAPPESLGYRRGTRLRHGPQAGRQRGNTEEHGKGRRLLGHGGTAPQRQRRRGQEHGDPGAARSRRRLSGQRPPWAGASSSKAMWSGERAAEGHSASRRPTSMYRRGWPCRATAYTLPGRTSQRGRRSHRGPAWRRPA